jgi:LAO/AO transport system kinase
MQATKSRQGLEYYLKGIREKNRVILAQAITVIESSLPADQDLANQILDNILPSTGNSIRLGITGAPGVGKSSFIESFGNYLTGIGKKVAVLTIDPSSQKTKGSILGDKTRMPSLAVNPNAFIRPTSSADAIGGVAHTTPDVILLCEAAGFELVVVETVGVGQSEVEVKNMTDMFLLLMLPGSGDELQGIKKGITEMADALIITKADGENVAKANDALAEFQHAFQLLFHYAGWTPKVFKTSAMLNNGMNTAWETVKEFICHQEESGRFGEIRNQQNIDHFHKQFDRLMKRELLATETFKKETQTLEELVLSNKISASKAAKKLLDSYVASVRGLRS